ncbi:MAG: diguanylate cyclase [Campylobacterota bacterium]|nr:diguanylate cyclase [Campylobacterota bacterium]
MSKATILIVDDEPINIDLIAQILADRYQLKIATSGTKALEILEATTIDLVLLDISMPQMDGYEVAKEIQSNKKTNHIPIIFLTSKDDKESIIQGFEVGAVDYITKPFNKQELLVRVSNHITTYLLQKDLKEQKIFIQTILDTQPTMIVISDGVSAEFVNQQILNFYQCETLKIFQEKYKCICNTFIQNDHYFHPGKINKGQNWIEELKKFNEDEQIVSIISQKDHKPKAFKISITHYKDTRQIITLSDINATIMKQLVLKDKTIHDPLTQAYNREYFDLNYEKYIKEIHNSGEYFGIAIVDIDHFKKVNDRYGHEIGDSILKEFVTTLNQYSRKSDILIRWGGEEFVIMMKVSSKYALAQALEHYRKVISHHEFKPVGKITCSIGGAFYENDEDITLTLQRADSELYKAKNSGRNAVCIDSF